MLLLAVFGRAHELGMLSAWSLEINRVGLIAVEITIISAFSEQNFTLVEVFVELLVLGITIVFFDLSILRRSLPILVDRQDAHFVVEEPLVRAVPTIEASLA